MRKFLIYLLTLFTLGVYTTTPSFAENYIKFKAEHIEAAINSKVPAKNREAAKNEYQKQMDQKTGKMSIMGLYKVCHAAGWNVANVKLASYDDCQNFVNYIVELSGFGTKSPTQKNCTDVLDGIWTINESGKEYQCVGRDGYLLKYDNACANKNNKNCIAIFENLNIAYRAAKIGVQKWAQTKWNGKLLTCKNVATVGAKDAKYVYCSAGGEAYTFKFKGFAPSGDEVQSNNFEFICKLANDGFDGQLVTVGDGTLGHGVCKIGDNVITSGTDNCKAITSWAEYMRYKVIPQTKVIRLSSSKFIAKDACLIQGGDIVNDKLKNDLSGEPIDITKFMTIEVRNSQDVVVGIKQYVRDKMGKTDAQVYCDLTTRRAWKNKESYEIIKCHIDEKDVDFVFKNLNTESDYRTKGGMQGMTCLTNGGDFDGKRCQNISETKCNEIKNANLKNCPECKQVKWEDGICKLPNSADVSNLDKGIEVAGVVATVVAATAITVASGGSAVGVWAVVSTTGTVLTAAGGAAVVTGEIAKTWGVYTEDVAREINKCLNNGDSGCAKDLLKKYLQKLVSYSKDLDINEQKALDSAFAKLFEQIPPEDDFWNWLDNDEVWKCDSRGNCTVKEKTQLWHYVMGAGETAMILGGALKSFASIASKYQATTKAVQAAGTARKARLINNMRGPAMLKDVAPEGYNTTLLPNEFVKKVTINGTSFTRNSELAKYLLNNGYKVGDIVELVVGGGSQVVTTTIKSGTEVVFNEKALAAIAAGVGGLVYNANGITVTVRRPTKENVVPEPTPVPVVVPDSQRNKKSGGFSGGEVIGAGVVGEVTKNDSGTTSDKTVTPPEPIVVPELTPAPSVVPESKSAPSVVPDSQRKEKKGLSGWGAAAIGAGVAGIGVGTALLIGGGKSHKSQDAGVMPQNDNVDLFNAIKIRADGIIGYVEDSQIELIPIETVNGYKEKIVTVRGHAVVLVKHNNNIIPFMVDTEDGIAKWMPFVSVDENTGMINKYVPKTDIMRTAKIVEKLTAMFVPMHMQYFASPNSDGLQFASPSTSGYEQLNDNSLRYLSVDFNKNTRLGVFFMA